MKISSCSNYYTGKVNTQRNHTTGTSFKREEVPGKWFIEDFINKLPKFELKSEEDWKASVIKTSEFPFGLQCAGCAATMGNHLEQLMKKDGALTQEMLVIATNKAHSSLIKHNYSENLTEIICKTSWEILHHHWVHGGKIKEIIDTFHSGQKRSPFGPSNN